MSNQEAFDKIVANQLSPEQWLASLWASQGLNDRFQHVDPNSKLGELIIGIDLADDDASKEYFQLKKQNSGAVKAIRTQALRKHLAAKKQLEVIQQIYDDVEEGLEFPYGVDRADSDNINDDLYEDLAEAICDEASAHNNHDNKDDLELHERTEEMIFFTRLFLRDEAELHFLPLRQRDVR